MWCVCPTGNCTLILICTVKTQIRTAVCCRITKGSKIKWKNTSKTQRVRTMGLTVWHVPGMHMWHSPLQSHCLCSLREKQIQHMLVHQKYLDCTKVFQQLKARRPKTFPLFTISSWRDEMSNKLLSKTSLYFQLQDICVSFILNCEIAHDHCFLDQCFC